jgi:CubicO group peptidase (beta-lactamase class C family)
MGCASTPAPCPEPAVAPAAAVAASTLDVQRLDAYVRTAMAEWNVPGLAIAVVGPDTVYLARGYGVRDVRTGEPVDTATLFGLLSPTKTITAAALGMLVDEDRIGWDDRVVEHLPGFRVADPALTAELRVRDLLSHGTGLQENHRLWYGRGGTRAEVAARATELQSVVPPRTEFHYNNLMYVVAGELVQTVSGVSWDEFVRRRIFAPLGMLRSTTTTAELEGRENVSSPHSAMVLHRVGPPRPRAYFDGDNIAPAGMVHTSVGEMIPWLQMHLNDGGHAGEALLSAGTVREMMRAQVPLPAVDDQRIGGDRAWGPLCGVADMSSRGYGLGWFTLDYRGRPAVLHGGGIRGQRSAVGLLPDDGVGVVILSNLQDTELALALTYYVFDLWLGVEPRDWSGVYRRGG